MSAELVGKFLLALAVIIVLARLFGWAARRIGQPPVIGEIVAGVLLGPTLFGHTLTDHLFPAGLLGPLGGLANVGLVLFMFIIGYELDQALIRGRAGVAVSVSLGSIVLPFGLGVALALWLARAHHVQRVLPFALFLGAAMAVTAFPVLARILSDRNMHRTELGGLALASAAVDDVAAWSLLAAVVAIGAADNGTSWRLLLVLPYLAVMVLLVRPGLRRLAAARGRAGRLTPDILAAILVGLLLSCFATEWMGLHAIFGAFLFGAVMPRAGAEELRHEILERLEQVSVLLLLPVFFVLAGLRVDLSTLDGRRLVELAAILAAAIVGKFAGAFAGARLHRIPARRAGALATLMNTRGLTEIVILTVGLQLHLLDGPLFSLMVVMALATTIMAGPMLSVIYPARLVERDVARARRAALGAHDAYRVLVLVPPDHDPADLLAQATGRLPAGQPAEIVLTRLLPYPVERIEVGSGLSGELLAVTDATRQLAALAEPLRARGIAVPVVVRFSADPAADFAALADDAEADLVLTVDEAGEVATGARR